MSGCVGVEIVSECTLTPKERAIARDSFVRDFEARFNDWVAIAKVCIEVERDRDFEVLGFSSWHSWLLNAAPRSRSYIYLVVGRYKELSVDIPEDELSQIPLGSAGVLKQLSSKIRQDPKIRQAARNKPGDLRQVIQNEFPMQHIEGIVEHRLRFTTSQWGKIESAFEAYKTVDENASLEIFIEWLVSECS